MSYKDTYIYKTSMEINCYQSNNMKIPDPYSKFMKVSVDVTDQSWYERTCST